MVFHVQLPPLVSLLCTPPSPSWVNLLLIAYTGIHNTAQATTRYVQLYRVRYSVITWTLSPRMLCSEYGVDLTSCGQHWSNSTGDTPIDGHNTDMVCDCGTETRYPKTVGTATTDCHCSACSVLCSSKVSDLVSSGCGSWRCPVDTDGGGGVHSRETSGGSWTWKTTN